MGRPTQTIDKQWEELLKVDKILTENNLELTEQEWEFVENSDKMSEGLKIILRNRKINKIKPNDNTDIH